jgi:hypothetical protein
MNRCLSYSTGEVKPNLPELHDLPKHPERGREKWASEAGILHRKVTSAFGLLFPKTQTWGTVRSVITVKLACGSRKLVIIVRVVFSTICIKLPATHNRLTERIPNHDAHRACADRVRGHPVSQPRMPLRLEILAWQRKRFREH